jgi:ABC-type lipoprotein release transport system permease subunit
MFSLTYVWAEIRRRKGRTILTALGLGVGVALVVTVSALSSGLDKAQDEVLEPLTGVGTNMSVTRAWADGLSVVRITHDPAVAGAAPRVVQLRDGRVQEGVIITP